MSKIEVNYIRRPNGFCHATSSMSDDDLSLIINELDSEGGNVSHKICGY